MPEGTQTRKDAAQSSNGKLTGEERYLKIQDAAYFLAEKDGFAREPLVYWLRAESKSGHHSDEGD